MSLVLVHGVMYGFTFMHRETLLSGSTKATTPRWPGPHAELVILDTKGLHVQEPAFAAAMTFANVEVHFNNCHGKI